MFVTDNRIHCHLIKETGLHHISSWWRSPRKIFTVVKQKKKTPLSIYSWNSCKQTITTSSQSQSSRDRLDFVNEQPHLSVCLRQSIYTWMSHLSCPTTPPPPKTLWCFFQSANFYSITFPMDLELIYITFLGEQVARKSGIFPFEFSFNCLFFLFQVAHDGQSLCHIHRSYPWWYLIWLTSLE